MTPWPDFWQALIASRSSHDTPQIGILRQGQRRGFHNYRTLQHCLSCGADGPRLRVAWCQASISAGRSYGEPTDNLQHRWPKWHRARYRGRLPRSGLTPARHHNSLHRTAAGARQHTQKIARPIARHDLRPPREIGDHGLDRAIIHLTIPFDRHQLPIAVSVAFGKTDG